MEKEITECILNSCIDFLTFNNLLDDGIYFDSLDVLILNKINDYVLDLDIKKTKQIIKYFGSVFDALKQVEDIDELLDTNNEDTFYRGLASSCIFNNCFNGSFNKIKTKEIILNKVNCHFKYFNNNENDNENNESENNESENNESENNESENNESDND